MKLRPVAALLILTCCALWGCRTVPSGDRLLQSLQAQLTPERSDGAAATPPEEPAQAAMAQWLEHRLRGEYRVLQRRFTATEPGSPKWSGLGGLANRYVEQTWGGTLQVDGWQDDEHYALLLWKLDEGRPRYLALVRGRDGLPGPGDRRLLGYFELAPASQSQPSQR